MEHIQLASDANTHDTAVTTAELLDPAQAHCDGDRRAIDGDADEVRPEYSNILQQNAANPNSVLNPAKNPKALRKYLALLLSSTQVSKQRNDSALNKAATSQRPGHPAIPGMGTCKHHHLRNYVKRHSAPLEVRRSTSPSAAPYTTADLLASYKNDAPSTSDNLHVNGNQSGHGNLEPVRAEGRWARDAERRPLSRRESKPGGVPSKESKGGVPFDSSSPDRQEQGSLDVATVASTVSPVQKNNNYFKPLATRNSFLRSSVTSPTLRTVPTSASGSLPQGAPPPQSQVPASTETLRTRQLTGVSEPARLTDPFPGLGKESEDILVAMGTNWNPSNVYPKSHSRPGSYSNAPINSGNGGAYLSHQLSVSQSPATLAPRYLNKRNMHGFGSRITSKEGEPRYLDPMIGASASFHHRLAELANLESETVRWERNRKLPRKKTRSET